MKKTESKIIDIIKNALKENAKKETLKTLGDRSRYIGSSDICQCALKSVFSKLEPVEHDIETLIRFKRGHMTETIINEAYCNIVDKFPGYTVVEQQLVIHPDYPYMQAHIDFIIYNNDMSVAKIIECKSVSSITDEAKDSWVKQVNWQLHLAKLDLFKGKNTTITASILAFDLNTGEVAEYGDYNEDTYQFEISIDKAQQIMSAVQEKNPELINAESSPLCSYCEYKGLCPNYTKNAEVIEDKDTITLIENFYSTKTQADNMKKQADALKSEILEMFKQDKLKAVAGPYVLKIGTRNGRETITFDTDTLKNYLSVNYPDIELNIEQFTIKKVGEPYNTIEVAALN